MPAHHASGPSWPDKSIDERLDALRTMTLDLYGYVAHAATEGALRAVRDHQCVDEAERASAERIAAMIEAHPDIWSPTCEAGHITGSALVVHRQSGRVLLLWHRKLERWLQMGGHGEFEMSAADIALREAQEESGLSDLRFVPRGTDPAPLDLDAHVIPASRGKPEHYHLDFRYLLATDRPKEIGRNDAESADLRWFTIAETLDLDLDGGLRRLIHKAEALMHTLEHMII